MQFMMNSECSKCCPLALTEASSRLLNWSIALLTMVCLKSARTSTSRCFWAMSCTSYLYAPACSLQSCIQPMLRYGLIGSHKSSEMKSDAGGS